MEEYREKVFPNEPEKSESVYEYYKKNFNNEIDNHE